MSYPPSFLPVIASQLTSPTNQQLHYPFRQNPLYTKQYPQISSHFIVVKKVIYGLSVPLTHSTPIHNSSIFVKLSNVKKFPNVAVRTNNTTLEGALVLQILLEGNGEPVRVQCV
jgi:hypothetical protein